MSKNTTDAAKAKNNGRPAIEPGAFPRPKSAQVIWGDFGSAADTVLDRLERYRKHLNAARLGGTPKYKRLDALRDVILLGLDVADKRVADAERLAAEGGEE